MGSAVRYLKRALAALAIVLIIAMTALLVLTRTSTFNRLLHAKLVSYVAETYRGQLTLGQIDAPFPGQVTLDQVVVRYRDAEVVRIAKVRASYSILPLLWGAIHLRVEVFKPQLKLSRRTMESNRSALAQSLQHFRLQYDIDVSPPGFG